MLINTYVIATDEKYLAVHENIGKDCVTGMESYSHNKKNERICDGKLDWNQ